MFNPDLIASPKIKHQLILKKKIEFVSKIYKEILKFNNEKITRAIGKWIKDLNRQLTKANIQVANKV